MNDNASVPDESVVMTDTSFAPAPQSSTPTTPPSPTNSGTTTSIPKSSNRNTGKIIATIFGLLLIVGGIGAGLVLVNQQQLVNQNAAATGSCVKVGQNYTGCFVVCVNRTEQTSCNSVASLGCPGICSWVPNAAATTAPGGGSTSGCTVTYNGTSSFTLSGSCSDVPVQRFNGASCPTAANPETASFPGAGTYSPNPSQGSCQQVDFQKNLNLPGGGVCSCTAAPKATCGQACTKDTDCAISSAGAGFQPVCNAGKCANPICPNSTTPESICSCSTPTGACGDLCGANGTQLYPTCTTGTVCGNSANGGTTGNRCLPQNPSAGFVTGGGICKNDKNTAVYCINHTDGTP